MASTSTFPNGELDISVVLRILGKEGPPPYNANQKVPPSLQHFTWLDLTTTWPTLTAEAEATPFDNELARDRADAYRDWEERKWVYAAECFKQLDVIQPIGLLQKEFFEGLLGWMDAKGRSGVQETSNEQPQQQQQYRPETPQRPRKRRRIAEMSEDGVSESADESDSDSESSMGPEEPRNCEGRIVAMEQEAHAFRRELEQKATEYHRNLYTSNIDRAKEQSRRLDEDRLRWEDVLKMGYDRWMKDASEQAASFKVHLLNACIASRSLVRIYDILRWTNKPSYVRLPLKEISGCYHQQAVLLYELQHLQLGYDEARCTTDHRLSDTDWAVEHQKHADFGFGMNQFRNGFDDHVGRYFGRMSIIHLIASRRSVFSVFAICKATSTSATA